jgi:hypothetical protein
VTATRLWLKNSDAAFVIFVMVGLLCRLPPRHAAPSGDTLEVFARHSRELSSAATEARPPGLVRD